MYFKRLISLSFAASLLFCSCAGGDKNESVMQTSEDETEEAGEDTIYGEPDDYYVEWCIPDLASIPSGNIADFNDMLSENGYDFGVKFVELDFVEYEKELSEISPDIVFAGQKMIDEEGNISDLPEKLISSGYFADLDEMLEDSGLYSSISEKLWESVRYEGSVYTIPCPTAQDEGVSIVFNLDKISEEDALNFDGDISSLSEILGDGILYYGISGFDFASYYEYENNADLGLWISAGEELKVCEPLESEECIEWLSEINSIYLKGQTEDSGLGNDSVDWSVYITSDSYTTEKENIYVYSSKAVLGTRYSASTGIASGSDKKEEAFELLELLHTDSDYANCLLYGNGVSEQNGYAVDDSGEKIGDMYLTKTLLGINETALWSEDGIMTFSSAQEKIDYYDENVLVSPAIGISLDGEYSDTAELLGSIDVEDLWKSENMEEDIAAVCEKTKTEKTDEFIRAVAEAIGEK